MTRFLAGLFLGLFLGTGIALRLVFAEEPTHG